MDEVKASKKFQKISNFFVCIIELWNLDVVEYLTHLTLSG